MVEYRQSCKELASKFCYVKQVLEFSPAPAY